MRILFWIALIVLIVFAVRSKLRAMAKKHGVPPNMGRGPAPAPGQIEAMAQCAHCGVYFPASETVKADGLDYCSPGHVRLPPK
ncbi:PP0621 family protein [Massilia oculi]|jgi:uncharacterized protein|uniref:PP0621 family protein n=1 Tax=Massilia oculi TaxID=945844 RepID=UPI001AAE283D|nr:PP0621 family protein [Massilia oculi]